MSFLAPLIPAFFVVLFFGTPILLALPGLRDWQWRRFFLAMLVVFFGITLPLFFFFASASMVPEWKGACKFGWVDCFYLGKLALSPLVLWSTAAFYAVEIWRVADRTKWWIVNGWFLGAVVATICFTYGLVKVLVEDPKGLPLLIVPLYTALWYVWRTHQLVQAAPIAFLSYFSTLAGSLPFWLGSVVWSKMVYFNLPEQAPKDCFVVTAAARGHESWVGPFVAIKRRGQSRRVNQQLVTFWRFESEWQRRHSRSHALFRRLYNQVGPMLARRITSPWRANLIHTLLKPAEWTARMIVSASTKKGATS